VGKVEGGCGVCAWEFNTENNAETASVVGDDGVVFGEGFNFHNTTHHNACMFDT